MAVFPDHRHARDHDHRHARIADPAISLDDRSDEIGCNAHQHHRKDQPEYHDGRRVPCDAGHGKNIVQRQRKIGHDNGNKRPGKADRRFYFIHRRLIVRIALAQILPDSPRHPEQHKPADQKKAANLQKLNREQAEGYTQNQREQHAPHHGLAPLLMR